MKKNKIFGDSWLITVDLDGTLLKSKKSLNAEDEINEKNIIELEKAISKGHTIAIITGRPWRDTKAIYEKINLNTIVANYNGAFIHNPSDSGFMPIKKSMNRFLVEKLIDSKSNLSSVKNILIEFEDSTHILDKGDEEILHLFHKHGTRNLNEYNWGDKLLSNPFSVSLRIDSTEVDKFEVLYSLRREYGNAFLFRIWENPYSKLVTIEINGKNAHKGNAMITMANYYGINSSKTISFGDGLNDTEMLNMATIGVAMKNASHTVKSFASDITDLDNDDAGVGEYLDKYFLN